MYEQLVKDFVKLAKQQDILGDATNVKVFKRQVMNWLENQDEDELVVNSTQVLFEWFCDDFGI